MSEYLSIGGVCRLLGISLSTAYRRIKAGTIVPAFRISGGHRRFERTVVTPVGRADDAPLRIVTYARVSSVDQKNDLDVQGDKLRRYVEERYAGGNHLHISDLGSGLNYRTKGLNQLLALILAGQVDVLVLNHKDRQLRFGAELVFKLCSFKGIVVERRFEQELAVDVIELMTVFCARLYGKRSHRNKKMIGGMDSVLQC